MRRCRLSLFVRLALWGVHALGLGSCLWAGDFNVTAHKHLSGFRAWQSLLSERENALLRDFIDYQEITFYLETDYYEAIKIIIQKYRQTHQQSPFLNSLNKYELFCEVHLKPLNAIDLNNYRAEDILYVVQHSRHVSEALKQNAMERGLKVYGARALSKPYRHMLIAMYESSNVHSRAPWWYQLNKFRKDKKHYREWIWLLLIEKRYEACLALTRYLMLHDKSDTWSYVLAECYLGMGQYKRAVRSYRKFLNQSSPKRHLSRFYKAQEKLITAMVKDKHIKTALKTLRTWVMHPSKQGERHLQQYLRLTMQYQGKQYQKTLDECLALYGNSWYVYLHERHIGLEDLALGRTQKAFKILNRTYAKRNKSGYTFLQAYFNHRKNNQKQQVDIQLFEAFYQETYRLWYDYLLRYKMAETNEDLWKLHASLTQTDTRLHGGLKTEDNLLRLYNPLRSGEAYEAVKVRYWQKRDPFIREYYAFQGKSLDQEYLYRLHYLIAYGYYHEATLDLKRRGFRAYEKIAYLHEIKRHAGKEHQHIQQFIRHVAGYRQEAFTMPYAFLREAYPMPMKDYIEELSQTYKVPMALIYAVMRTESHFNPRALSSVGAMGLMQIMPQTGKFLWENNTLVEQEDDPKWHKDVLYESALNVRLGVLYMGELIRSFHGNAYHAVAAYNAGSVAVRRWLRATSRSDDIVFLLTIPYYETAKYVERVFCAKEIYETLYDF